jgi:hypothetical protein
MHSRVVAAVAAEEPARSIPIRDIGLEARAGLLVRLMLEGDTLAAAAKEAELSTRQARRILNKPENQAALRFALQTMRSGAIELARARMEQISPRAVEWLIEVGEGKDPHAKVKAAAQILDRNRGTQRGQVYSVGPAEHIDSMSDVELMQKAQEAALILKKEARKALAAEAQKVEAAPMEETDAR